MGCFSSLEGNGIPHVSHLPPQHRNHETVTCPKVLEDRLVAAILVNCVKTESANPARRGGEKKLRLVFVGERNGSKCQVQATRTSDKHNELSERLQLQRPVSTSASVTSYFINLKKKRGIIKNHCNHSVSPHYNLHNLPNHPAEKSSPRSSHISPCISRIHDDRFGSSIFEPPKADFNSFSTLARNSWWFRGQSASNVRVEE